MENDINESKDKFLEELTRIIGYYGVEHFCICGTIKDKFFGQVGTGGETATDFVMSVVNAGRLWQHARTSIRSFLDGFERGGTG